MNIEQFSEVTGFEAWQIDAADHLNADPLNALIALEDALESGAITKEDWMLIKFDMSRSLSR